MARAIAWASDSSRRTGSKSEPLPTLQRREMMPNAALTSHDHDMLRLFSPSSPLTRSSEMWDGERATRSLVGMCPTKSKAWAASSATRAASSSTRRCRKPIPWTVEANLRKHAQAAYSAAASGAATHRATGSEAPGHGGPLEAVQPGVERSTTARPSQRRRNPDARSSPRIQQRRERNALLSHIRAARTELDHSVRALDIADLHR